MTNDRYTHIGEVIAYIRKEKGLSQAQLAEGICSREYVGKVEKGLQFPTTYTINQFCEKLGLDIYEEYSLLLRHGSFDAHQIIMALNDGFSQENCHILPELLAKYEPLCTEESDILYQYICYAKAICAMELDKDADSATTYALLGIHAHYQDYSYDSDLPLHIFNNIDLLLIYYYITCAYEQKEHPDMSAAYLNLYHYLIGLLSNHNYIVHKKYHFEINLLTNVVVNIVSECEDIIPDLELYEMVCTCISLKKKYNYSIHLTNLLFDKCYLSHKLGYIDIYNDTLQHAIHIGNFYLGEEGTQKLINWLNHKIN